MTTSSSYIALAIVVLSGLPARADDAATEDAYQSVWSSLSELLRRREYGSAGSLLESAADDPELQYQGQQIESDKAVVAGLQTLERVVNEQLAHMSVEMPLDLSGVEFTFVRYEVNPKGNEVVLKSTATGRESPRRVAELPTSTWIALTKSHLNSLDQPELILGVFAGFDRSADSKLARQLLNDAASAGADVTLWLARLDQAEADRKRHVEERNPQDDEPLLGPWRVVVGRGDRQLLFNADYRADGTVLRTTSPATLRKLPKKAQRNPNRTFAKGQWRKLDEGRYRVTYPDGATGEITVVGDRYWGKAANGTPLVGTRQVTKPK